MRASPLRDGLKYHWDSDNPPQRPVQPRRIDECQDLGTWLKKKRKKTISSEHIFLANSFMDKDDSHICVSSSLYPSISLPLSLWSPSTVPSPQYMYEYEGDSSSWTTVSFGCHCRALPLGKEQMGIRPYVQARDSQLMVAKGTSQSLEWLHWY